MVRIGGGTTPVDAALDPVGVRLATSQGAGPSFFVPDLHGNAAALWGQASAAFVDARRYDPYGETLDHYPASPTVRTPWRFGGRLVEGEATDAEAYDFGFRSYLADIGSFGSIDDVAGQATDVRSLNRFLYAQGDPVTLIDPDGHMAMRVDGGGGGATAAAKARHRPGSGPHRPAGSGGYRPSWRNSSYVAKQQRADAGGRRDPVKVTTPVRGDRYDWDAPTASAGGSPSGDGNGGFDLGGFVHGGLDVLGFVPVLGAVPDLINAGLYSAEGDFGNAALSAASAIPLAGDAVAAAKLVVKYGDDAIAVAGFVARHGDEGAEVLGAVFRTGDDVASGADEAIGIVYRRTSLNGSTPYIGQAKSEARFIERQAEHSRANKGDLYVYEEIGRAKPGDQLDRLEEY